MSGKAASGKSGLRKEKENKSKCSWSGQKGGCVASMSYPAVVMPAVRVECL